VQVEAALGRLADEIAARLHESNPLVLTVMAALWSLPANCCRGWRSRSNATTCMRRATATSRRVERWPGCRAAYAGAWACGAGTDDILDEGLTLAAIKRWVLEQGARPVSSPCFRKRTWGVPNPLPPISWCAAAESLCFRLWHGRQGCVAQPAGDLRPEGSSRAGLSYDNERCPIEFSHA